MATKDRLFLGAMILVLLANSQVARRAAAQEKAVDFARDVQPIFAKHCISCHGAKKQKSGFRLDNKSVAMRGGDLGETTIVPGKSAASFLLKVISDPNADVTMPPEGDRLSAAEIDVIRRWIDQGATWPEALSANDHLATDHWSFQPLNRDPLPLEKLEKDEAWSANSIDAFVRRKLAASGLTSAATSDRVSFIRRVFLDHLGVPPTPDEVQQFLHDRRADAFDQLVDRVLCSPRYGERWGRHWLDIVRFAESHGFETNRERPHAWPYRDYVIDSLNADKPYDRFVQEQIAGDSMGADVATGFLVAGPYDLVKSPDISLTLMQRQEELADMVNTTGATFLGLTLGCARCHSHKFDPIPQKDFYSMQAVFAGVRHADRALPSSPDQKEQLAAVDERIAMRRRQLATFIPTANVSLVYLDDEPAVNADQQGMRVLLKPAGNGINPAGTARGQKDDPGSTERSPNLSQGRYTWWSNQQGKNVAAYRPNVRGRFRVWLSWGTGWKSHVTDAKYLLDSDGNLQTGDDQQTIAVVNQQQFADGSDGLKDQSLWSGFRSAGVFELTPSSTVVLQAGQSGTATTADALLLESTTDGVAEAKQPKRPAFRPVVNAQHNVERISPTEARFVRFTILETNSSEPCIDELELYANGRNVALAERGAVATSSGNFPNHPLHKLEHINDGQFGNGRSWISNQQGRGWVQIELAKPAAIDRIEWARDRQAKYGDRLAIRYAIDVALEPDQWTRVASSDDRLPVTTKVPVNPAYQFDSFEPQVAAQGREWLKDLQHNIERRAALAKPVLVYAGTFSQPQPTHRLYRGDPMQKREVVAPDALSVTNNSLKLEVQAPEQQRRIALARWIADPRNPLTARVMVNRLWQHHFGTGIVATPSDFGANGAQPSHPELLDWMANELVSADWSLKHVHRLILTSNTYQQSSRPRAAGLAQDADARLLWRFPPRRLEAEAIRDSILASTQTIDLRMGGRGYDAFEVQMENVRHFFPKEEFGPAEWRRMAYMTKYRQEQDGTFGVFDCPDGSQTMPRRPVSTSPLQAFNLLNSSFILQQAELLADLLQRKSPSIEQQVRHAFDITLARQPDQVELTSAARLAEQHGLVAFCRALLNCNEFLFVP